MSKLHLTAAQIDRAVRELYVKGGYVVLSEVRNGTGYARSVRTADMVAISTWPSRGLFTEGFEIKSSKSDLQRELATPQKAEEIAKYCTWWWIATPVGLSEGLMIPPNWGVIEVDDKLKAKVLRRGTMLEPQPMDSLFTCSVLRSFAETYTPNRDIEAKIAEARTAAQEDARTRAGRRLKELEDAIANFKEISGIDLAGDYGHVRWDAGRVAEAVKLILDMRSHPLEEMMTARKALLAGAEAIDAAIGPLAAKS